MAYRELKGNVTDLLGDKGWKTWWKDAKPALKRDPLIGMSSGSQPSFRLMRQADKYEDRLRRKFDLSKDPQDKLLKVMAYLDEISREEKNGSCDGCVDEDLLAHFGNVTKPNQRVTATGEDQLTQIVEVLEAADCAQQVTPLRVDIAPVRVQPLEPQLPVVASVIRIVDHLIRNRRK